MRSDGGPDRRRDRNSDAGMVTAELAACLPVLMLLLGLCVSAVGVAGARVRVQDAAHEAARASSRGDPAIGLALAERAVPGVRVEVSRSSGQVTAVATARMHLFARWLPAVELTERCVALDDSAARDGTAAADS